MRLDSRFGCDMVRCGAMNKGTLMLRRAAKTIARQVPEIGRLIKQRDELLVQVERLRHQLAKKESSASFDFGGLCGLSPVTDNWGFARGRPVDRVYIERFLSQHRGDIRGHVLEIGDNSYTLRFGEGRIGKSVIADVNADNAKATIIADLVNAPQIPDGTFDCVILTQVIVLIFDVEAALRTVSRILKPGGVALITVPGISQIGTDATESAAWSWSFYPNTLRRLLVGYFDSKKLIVESYGNVKTAIGFLAGLAQEDLAPDDFQHNDSRYPLIVAARGIKPGPPPRLQVVSQLGRQPAVSVLMPVFNAARYVAEAIESVRAQTLNGWELIIVDDGSTDDSYAIACSYAQREPDRIRVFRHPDRANHGLSRTANRALAEACGNYIAFLDADDTWMPERLAHDVAVLDANPAIAAVISNSLYWWMDEDWPAWVDRFNAPLNCVWPPRSFFTSVWLRHESSVPCPAAFTVRTALFRELGGFDESYAVAMDMKMFAEVAFRYPVFVADVCNAEYRRTRDSLWSQSITDGRDADCRRRFLKWMKALIERDGADDPALLAQFIANLSHPSIAPLIGGRILGRRASAADRGGDDPAIIVEPSPANWTGSLRLEAGQYFLQVLCGHFMGTGTLAVEVAIKGSGVTLASSRSALPSTLDPARGLRVPFNVPPAANDISITVSNEGNGTAALRAIEVRAEGWQGALPLVPG
jgi:glycosyltransferase involved in cell wall biosynthesis/SAM-dependent methyltransferase